MPPPDITSILGLAFGILAVVGGASCVFASIVMLAPAEPVSAEPPRQIDLLELLGDFLFVLMDSLPFFSLFRAARALPETAMKLKSKWVSEPLIRRFFFTGLFLSICGSIILGFRPS